MTPAPMCQPSLLSAADALLARRALERMRALRARLAAQSPDASTKVALITAQVLLLEALVRCSRPLAIDPGHEPDSQR